MCPIAETLVSFPGGPTQATTQSAKFISVSRRNSHPPCSPQSGAAPQYPLHPLHHNSAAIRRTLLGVTFAGRLEPASRAARGGPAGRMGGLQSSFTRVGGQF